MGRRAQRSPHDAAGQHKRDGRRGARHQHQAGAGGRGAGGEQREAERDRRSGRAEPGDADGCQEEREGALPQQGNTLALHLHTLPVAVSRRLSGTPPLRPASPSRCRSRAIRLMPSPERLDSWGYTRSRRVWFGFLVLRRLLMPAAVKIADDRCLAEELRSAASRCRDGNAVRRMLALALLPESHSRAGAARACGMERQTLRDWVHQFNAEGIAGLVNRWGGGCKPKLAQAQTDRLAELVRSGPDLAVHGMVRWRRIDLARVMHPARHAPRASCTASST